MSDEARVSAERGENSDDDIQEIDPDVFATTTGGDGEEIEGMREPGGGSPAVGGAPRDFWHPVLRGIPPPERWPWGVVKVEGELRSADTDQTRPIGPVGPLNTSHLVGTDSDILRNRYMIPDELEIRIPSPDENVHSIQEGEVAFYTSVLKLGLSFPLPHFICEFFQTYHLCPAQLAPNGWCMLLGALVLSYMNDVELLFSDFKSTLTVKKNPTDGGYYLTIPRDKQTVHELPSSNRGWHEEFFFLKGFIGLVPHRFGAPRKHKIFIIIPYIHTSGSIIHFIIFLLLFLSAILARRQKLQFEDRARRLEKLLHPPERYWREILSPQNLNAAGIMHSSLLDQIRARSVSRRGRGEKRKEPEAGGSSTPLDTRGRRQPVDPPEVESPVTTPRSSQRARIETPTSVRSPPPASDPVRFISGKTTPASGPSIPFVQVPSWTPGLSAEDLLKGVIKEVHIEMPPRLKKISDPGFLRVAVKRQIEQAYLMAAIGQLNAEGASTEERIEEQVRLTTIEVEKCAVLQAKLEDSEFERATLLSKLSASEQFSQECSKQLKERDAELMSLKAKAEEGARFIIELEKQVSGLLQDLRNKDADLAQQLLDKDQVLVEAGIELRKEAYNEGFNEGWEEARASVKKKFEDALPSQEFTLIDPGEPDLTEEDPAASPTLDTFIPDIDPPPAPDTTTQDAPGA